MRVVSVLGIVVFLTRGYKSEAIMAFGAGRNRDKVEEDHKRRIFGSICFWQRILWQRMFLAANPLAARFVIMLWIC